MNSKFASVLEEISNSVESNVKEITEKIMQNIAVSTAVDQKKNAVIYFYKNDEVSVHYKVLSSQPILQDNFAFYSLYKPSDDLF